MNTYGQALVPTIKVSNIIRRNGQLSAASRQVPEEVPVAFSYSGTTHAVMMASPADIEDFAVGFSLSEGIISSGAEIEAIDIVSLPQGIDVQMVLTPAKREALTARRRHMAGPVGCGLCGVESITEAMRKFAPVAGSDLQLTAEQVVDAVGLMYDMQPFHRATGAVHAAGFYLPEGEGGSLTAVREDVGRHNALDKLAGALLRQPNNPSAGLGVGGKGAVIVTSRVSLEMVQKTAAIGSPFIIAISAPTALAIRIAEQLNITLIALVRGTEFDIYTHAERVSG